MKIKDLEFVEQYLYETPSENHFRGINVKINGNKVLSIDFERSRYPISTEEENTFLPERDLLVICFDGIIPQTFIAGNSKNDVDFTGQKYFLLEDKESAKEEARAIVKRYVNFFIEE